ncbi:histidine kinase [Acutalibacter sp. JLR.KK004]|uniref:histidine kinase n=1 Tax=Acutalibacter sp. JLR.KK004 TaxID=3112622 RepID=UPI001372C934
MTDSFGNLISMLDYVLCTRRRRHITGGVLLSVSLLFGGLALTAITLRADMDKEEDDDE